MRQKGFTLIEVLIVIAIIGILTGIILLALARSKEQAKISKAQAEIKQLYNAFALLENDTGLWPGHKTPGIVESVANNEICSDGCLYGLDDPRAGLMATDGNYPNWKGPYLEINMVDPWGNPYFFDTDYDLGGVWAVVIGSYGPNGAGNNLYDDDDIIYILVQE